MLYELYDARRLLVPAPEPRRASALSLASALVGLTTLDSLDQIGGLKTSPMSASAARVHARTNSSGSAAKVGLLVGNFCTLSKCFPFSRKWAQH